MPTLPLFKIEDYLADWEFKAPYLLCTSDAESWTMQEILEMADPQTLKMWESLSLGYTETQGLPLLKEEISTIYPTLSPDHILTFAGAEEGIYAAMRTILSPGDHAIVFRPCYQSLETLPKNFGAQVTTLSLEAENRWQLPLKALEQAIQPATKLIILNFPHNPTGALISKEALLAIVELARRNNAYLFSDEVYRFMEIDERQRLPAIADSYERGISLSVTSKAFGLAGLRIGWLASQDKHLLAEIAKTKHYLSICNSAPSEILALIALRAKERILKRNHDILSSNLALLDSFFETHRNLFQWVRPSGGCIAFPRFNGDVESFAQHLIEKEGVLLLPGSVYDWPGSYFRIGFGRKNMPEALKRLERFLAQSFVK